MLPTTNQCGVQHPRRNARCREACTTSSTSNKNAPLREQVRQIRWFLQEQGPNYLHLLLYLSSRIDLLPAEFCREFSFTPDTRPPFSISQVQHMIEEEFPPALRRTLSEFNSIPAQSNLLTQSHNAKLANGVPVTVTMLRPEYVEFAKSTHAMPTFNKVMVQEYCGECVDDGVFLDCSKSLRRKCDFTTLVKLLDRMMRGELTLKVVRGRRVYPELSNARVLTTQRLEGHRLEEATRQHNCNKERLANDICYAWFDHALRADAFAVDAQAHNIIVVDGAVVFDGCDFAELPSGMKENLWNYLMATIGDDPDKAAMYLLREMIPCSRGVVDLQVFRSRFRQSAYFGALQPVLGTNSNAIAQLVFQHWKTALEYGYCPKPQLLCFYRGLFSMARIAQDLSPSTDPLRRSMEEARSDAIVCQFKEMLDWRYWSQNSEKFAKALVTLPRILDDALTKTAVPDRVAPPQPQHTASKSAGTNMLNAMCVLLMLLIVLRSSIARPSMEWPTLVLLTVAGLMVLRNIAD